MKDKRNFNFGGGFGGFAGFGFGNIGGSQQSSDPDTMADPDEESTAETTAGAKRAHRRTKECTELSQRYEYRRAFSEVKMLEAMRYVQLQNGVTYNFITAGDVDSLTYLKVVLNQHDLDFVLLSTWCMAAEDILQVQQWYERWLRSSTPNIPKQGGRRYLRIIARFTPVAT